VKRWRAEKTFRNTVETVERRCRDRASPKSI
jgi:hypothetical protein